jgi:glucokinase
MTLRILVGDLGGTHTRLALATQTEGRLQISDTTRYENARHPGLDAILADYLGRHASIETGCLAVAGPTDGRTVCFTNLDWVIDADQLAERHGLASLRLVNDFSAVGWALSDLGAGDLAILQAGKPAPRAPRIALGAGTGLGVSLCVWREGPGNGYYQPLPSEGGHISFAPLDAEQDRLLAFQRRAYGRVSMERLVSGPGLIDIHRFCLAEAGRSEADDPCLAQPNPARAIAEAALAASQPEAQRALDLFVTLYGQMAGDLALTARAAGGVTLAGGIAPQILPTLQGPRFLRGFCDKGRFSAWMDDLPVAVALDPDLGLRGAAVAALRQ